MGLSNYQSCSYGEKRAVLRTFWGIRPDQSDKVNRAASEYGPYALAMVAVITLELAIISMVLFVDGSGWAWLATVATALALWSLWRTRVCHQAIRSLGTHR